MNFTFSKQFSSIPISNYNQEPFFLVQNQRFQKLNQLHVLRILRTENRRQFNVVVGFFPCILLQDALNHLGEKCYLILTGFKTLNHDDSNLAISPQ